MPQLSKTWKKTENEKTVLPWDQKVFWIFPNSGACNFVVFYFLEKLTSDSDSTIQITSKTMNLKQCQNFRKFWNHNISIC